MSATAPIPATPAARPTPKRGPRQAALHVVSSPVRHLPRAGFVSVVLAILVGGLAAVLLLTTTMQERAELVQEAKEINQELRERSQTLTVELAERQSPQGLAKSARALGMVPAGHSIFLDLDEGRVRTPGVDGADPASVQ